MKRKTKLKLGDTVILLAGKDKGKTGRLSRIISLANATCDKLRVIVEGVNMQKKHVKPNPERGVEGGIVEQEGTIHISNVALLNPNTNKGDKVGYKTLEDKKKVRYFKSNDEVVES